MSYVTLSGKRTPLAENQCCNFSWGIHYEKRQREEFKISFKSDRETAGGKERWVQVNLDVLDATAFACYVAQRMTREADPREGLSGLNKTKTDAEALRDLADLIEGKNTRARGPDISSYDRREKIFNAAS